MVMFAKKSALAVLPIAALCLVPFGCDASKNAPGGARPDAYRSMTAEEKADVAVGTEASLSDSEKSQQKAARLKILEQTKKGDDAERSVRDAVENAKSALLPEDFKTIQDNQAHWLKYEKGREINARVAGGADVGDAYEQTLLKRAENIEKLTSKLLLSHETQGLAGFYEDNSGSELEVYKFPDGTANAVLRIAPDAGGITLTATGKVAKTDAARIDSDNSRILRETARLCSELRPGLCFDIETEGTGGVSIRFAPEVLAQSGGDAFIRTIRAASEGTYRRCAAQRGDSNVDNGGETK